MNLKPIVASLALLPLSPISFIHAQDEGSGEQSPAESSVTGSSSEPVVNAPSSNDSNPIISIVRLGLPIESALTFSLTDVFALASSSNDFSTFLGASQLVASGVDLNFVVVGLNSGISLADIESADDSGLSISDFITAKDSPFDTDTILKLLALQLDGVAFLTADQLKELTDTRKLSADQILSLHGANISYANIILGLDSSLTVSQIIDAYTNSIDFADFKFFTDNGLNSTQILALLALQLNDASYLSNEELRDLVSDKSLSYANIIALHGAGISYANIILGLSAGLTVEQIIDAAAQGIDFSTYKDLVDSGASTDPALASYTDSFKLTDNAKLIASIERVIKAKSDTYAVNDFQVALNAAVTVADSLLKDVVVTSSLPTPITVSTLTSNGYNYELVRLLVEYGAIGSKGSSLANEILGDSYSSFTSTGTLAALANTSDYLSYLETLTGSATFGDIDSESSVLSVLTDNIMLAPGSNITIGQPSQTSTIDVKDFLTSSNGVDEQRKILIVGAAKDLDVAGNVTFTNTTNDVEDHALVLGAADEVMVSGSDITYTGSNLAIGAGGDDLSKESNMYLHNTTITTGGNLAAGMRKGIRFI